MKDENLYNMIIEKKRIKDLMAKLCELDSRKPDKKYVEIFYQRYVKNRESKNICEENNITLKELNQRLLEIVKYSRLAS